MSSVSTNSTKYPDETIHSSSSSTYHQPAQNTVVPTLLDNLFPDVPMDFDFESLNPGIDALLAPPFQVPLHPINGGPQYHIPPETPPTATFHTLPQPTIPAILPGILQPLTFGTFDPGDRAPLGNTVNPSIPMASLTVPSWSVTQVNPEPERGPVSGLQLGVPAGMPTMVPGNANATSTVTAGGPAAATTSTAVAAFAGASEARAPVSRCSCFHRINPLIRVDDTIEWVRPGVMKMVVWFNWTPNAEAETQESWEHQPREA